LADRVMLLMLGVVVSVGWLSGSVHRAPVNHCSLVHRAPVNHCRVVERQCTQSSCLVFLWSSSSWCFPRRQLWLITVERWSRRSYTAV